MPDYVVTLSASDDQVVQAALTTPGVLNQPSPPATVQELLQRHVDRAVTQMRQTQERDSEGRLRSAVSGASPDVRAKLAMAIDRVSRMSPDQQAAVLDKVISTRVQGAKRVRS